MDSQKKESFKTKLLLKNNFPERPNGNSKADICTVCLASLEVMIPSTIHAITAFRVAFHEIGIAILHRQIHLKRVFAKRMKHLRCACPMASTLRVTGHGATPSCEPTLSCEPSLLSEEFL